MSNIKYYLKDILQDEPPQEFVCTYENEQLISVKKKPLPDWAKELTFN